MISKRNKNTFKLGFEIKLAILISLGLVIRASFFLRRRDPNDFSQVDSSNIIAILLIGASSLFLLSKRGFSVMIAVWKSPFKFFILYMFYCAITSIWSGTAIYSIYRSMELLVVLFLISYIVYSIKDIFNLKKIFLFYLLVSLIAGIGYYIKRGNFSFGGFHTNSYSLIAALAIVIANYNYRYFKKYKKIKLAQLSRVLFFLGIISLIIGTSSASNISFIVGLLILIFLDKRKIRSKIFIIILIFLIVNFWLFFGDFINTF